MTRYTNSQNAVKEKDFIALTPDFRTWKREMEAKYDVFLEIQRGAWDSQQALQKQRQDVKRFTRMCNAFDLLKAYGSGWLGEAGTAFSKKQSLSAEWLYF
ncbi:MAG: AIPR family protein [Bryobacteraceae bacterium]